MGLEATRRASAERPKNRDELLAEVDRLQGAVRVLTDRLVEFEPDEAALDDTEERLRRSEEEVRDVREKLAHVTRMSSLGEMATGIAHEINQPLAAVATYAQACSRMIRSRTADDVELLESLDRISQEALRAGAIINKLKDLVRRRGSEQVTCNLSDLVRDVAGLVAMDARHNGVDLTLKLAEELPEIVADRVQIQQVVLNLTRNGMEAMEGNPASYRSMIVETALGDDGFVEAAVIDQGEGVDDHKEGNPFAPFYTTKQSGMGMGLSISRSILRSHGGRIWFTRNPERGMTFRFALPTHEVS